MRHGTTSLPCTWRRPEGTGTKNSKWATLSTSPSLMRTYSSTSSRKLMMPCWARLVPLATPLARANKSPQHFSPHPHPPPPPGLSMWQSNGHLMSCSTLAGRGFVDLTGVPDIVPVTIVSHIHAACRLCTCVTDVGALAPSLLHRGFEAPMDIPESHRAPPWM